MYVILITVCELGTVRLALAVPFVSGACGRPQPSTILARTRTASPGRTVNRGFCTEVISGKSVSPAHDDVSRSLTLDTPPACEGATMLRMETVRTVRALSLKTMVKVPVRMPRASFANAGYIRSRAGAPGVTVPVDGACRTSSCRPG